MKLSCDLSVTSAPHRPATATQAPWGTPWASPITATAAGLVLDFAAGAYGADGTPGSLSGLMNFSRTSTASVIDSSGTLVSSPSDSSRLVHDPVSLARLGLLLESSRSKLFANSAAPATQTIAVTAQPYALSFYGTGTVALSGAHAQTIVGGGSYPSRTKVSFTPTAGNLTLTLAGQIQAPQLEVGGTASSYVPTTTPPGQRAADDASIALGPWYDSSAGTLVLSGYVQGASANDRIIEIDNGSAGTRLSLLWNTVLGKPQFQVWNGGALQAAIAPPGNSVAFGTEFRVAIAYAPNSFGISLNGGAVAGDNAGTVPSGVNVLRLGRAAGGAQGLTVTESLVYYPQRLSDTELQALSA